MRFVKTVAVVALFSGACAHETIEQGLRPPTPSVTYNIEDYRVQAGSTTTVALGKKALKATASTTAPPATMPEKATAKSLQAEKQAMLETLSSASSEQRLEELSNVSALNAAALSIFGSIEAIGFNIVRFTPADPNAKPYPQSSPIIIVANETECGGAFSIRRNLDKPTEFITSMEYSGKLAIITNPEKVNGDEMWNGKIGHPEGTLIEEKHLEESADLMYRHTTVACATYHEEQRNKQAEPSS